MIVRLVTLFCLVVLGGASLFSAASVKTYPELAVRFALGLDLLLLAALIFSDFRPKSLGPYRGPGK